MAKVVTDTEHYEAIADIIRNLAEDTEQRKPSEMPNGIYKAYNVAYEKGKAEGGGENPLYYASVLSETFANRTVPLDSLTIHLAIPIRCYQTFKGTMNLKKVKFITDDKERTFELYQTFREASAIEEVDFTECSRKLTNIAYLFFNATKLKSVKGALDISNNTSYLYAFHASSLQDIEFVPNTIGAINIRFNSGYLTDKSIQSIIDGLTVLPEGETKTLTLDNVKAKLTEEQKATITQTKGWTLA